MQTPPEMLRDMQARDAAIRRYALANGAFVTKEQEHLVAGDPVEAYGAYVYSEWCQRALRAERDDPQPRPPCDCRICAAVYS